jgi:class 3 adenylate cyclase/tetratricopeptide (TPR) repeat protein
LEWNNHSVAFCSNCGASLPSGARFCPSCAAPVAGDRPPEERKLATVLFADLVGSTRLADSQDAERTRALLNRFYDAMATEIAVAGGTIEKFIGDAVVAAFGAPAAQEHHAARALHAALSMRLRLEALFGDSLRLRIGVNTGDVVVGEAREGSSFVTGDAVNVAARLEQSAKPGQILVGERTVAAVRNAFEFGPEETVEAKGKARGVVCSALLGVATSRPEHVPPSSFVGREGELARLRDLYVRLADSRESAVVTIVGEAGIGKSTLVSEFHDWLSTRVPQPPVRLGRCLPFGQAGAYAPLGEIVREHGDLLDRRPILGLTIGKPAPRGLHPLAVGEHLCAAWLELLTELAGTGTAVVIVEDLHWAEPELLQLLDDGARRLQGSFLLLGTARNDLERDGTTIHLGSLSPVDAGRIVDQLAPAAFSEGVRASLVDRADGNPFFLEEILRMVGDQGVTNEIRKDVPLPDTVQALLAARIDLLSPAEKFTLQAAAAIGRTFSPIPVRALVECDPPVDELVARGFVRTTDGGFAFIHALTRDVAYASLTTPRRARLHARYAGWLEDAGGGKDEDAAELAHHFAEAVRPEDEDLAWPGEEEELARLRGRAVSWLRRAAELAVGRYEMKEAVSLLERAVALEVEPLARLEIWREIAHANVLYFDGKAFAAALEAALAGAVDDATRADLRAELAFQTISRAGMWGTPPPTNLVDGWVESTLELADRDSPARAKALIARCYSNYDKSPDDAAEAIRIADRLDDPTLRSYAYDVGGLVAFVRGDYHEALEWTRRRARISSDLDDPDSEANIYADAISPAVACRQLEEAREYATAHDEITRPLSPHHRLHGVSGLLELEELIGNWSGVAALQAQVERAVQANTATPCVRNARSLLVCALAHAYLGDEEEAERLERQAEVHAMRGYGTVIDTPRLRLALRRNDLSAVASLLGEPAVRRSNWFYLSSVAAHLDGLAALGARERVEAEAARVLRPGSYLEPFALRASGIVSGDHKLIAQALGLFEDLGLEWHAGETRAWL